jgi:hypothetical protein
MSKERLPLMTLPCKKSFSELRAEGFHCSSCNKKLVDFRNRSTEEINATIRNSEQKVCGVFDSRQFASKVSHLPIGPLGMKVGMSLLGILGFLGPVVLSSCTDAKEAQEEKQNAFDNLKFPMSVEGTLIDEETKAPLPFASVSILQNGKIVKQVSADGRGNFSVRIERDDFHSENFDFIVGGRDTLEDFRLGSFAGKQRVRLTICADARDCTIGSGMLGKVSSSGAAYQPGEIAVYVEPMTGVSIPPPPDPADEPLVGDISIDPVEAPE